MGCRGVSDIGRAAVLTRAHVWGWWVRKGRVGEGATVANIDIKNRDLSMRRALKILQEEVTAKEWPWL